MPCSGQRGDGGACVFAWEGAQKGGPPQHKGAKKAGPEKKRGKKAGDCDQQNGGK